MIDANRSLPFRTTRVLLLCAALLLSDRKPLSNLRERSRERQRVQELSALEPIAAHTHISAASPRFLAMLGDLHMHMLDILYVDDTSPYRSSLDRQKADALKFIAASGGRATLCTTFDPFGWKEGSFAQKVTDSLNRDFAEGAVAAKVWKNIGMEIKDSSGKYLFRMILSSSRFTTILPSTTRRSSFTRPPSMQHGSPNLKTQAVPDTLRPILSGTCPPNPTLLIRKTYSMRAIACWRRIPIFASSLRIWAVWKPNWMNLGCGSTAIQTSQLTSRLGSAISLCYRRRRCELFLSSIRTG